jgi:ABC-2 type transport system ATP-binding protein
MAETVIRARNLTKRFGAITAVSGLTLEVAAGEVFGLLGPDGAGKTTTLRLMCGLVDPSEGQVRVADFDVCSQLDAVRDRIGYMAQRFGLYGDLTVEENMRFYGDLFGLGRGEREALMTKLLRMTRMEPFAKRRAAQLSGGMKQKLALACTLLHRPRVLFLDEPTNGVDPVSRRDFWIILRQLVSEGLTVFLSTAYLDEAERCDRVGLLYKGRLIRVGRPAELKESLPEPCFEVRCGDLRAAKEALRKTPGVSSVELAGASLHVFASGVSAEQLVAAAGRPCQARPVAPSLEDVFIALIRREESQWAA